MTNSSSDRHHGVNWDARFRSEETPWERGEVHPAVANWMHAGLLSTRQSIYVPGCGRGLEPTVFAQAGLRVTASDLASSAAVFQREALSSAPDAQVIEGDSLSWRPDQPFDLLYEQTFLCAIHPRLRPDYEAMAHAVLKPGGRLLALFMQKEDRGGPPYGCSIPAMQKLFSEDRWEWPGLESFAAFPHPNLNGKPELAGILTRR